MRLQLPELQQSDKETQRIKAARRLQKGWENIDRVLYHQSLAFVLEIICLELINWYHDDPLAGYFGIDKTRELITKKYYQPILRYNVKAYMKSCNTCLASKVICHKPYKNLQSLSVLTHRSKNLSIDFVTSLPMLTDQKSETYDLILIIVNWFTKMIYYKPVKIKIDVPSLVKVIINAIIRYHGFPDSIVSDQGSVFILKFWLLLCFFFGIKRYLFIYFYPQTDGQIERQNSSIKAYLRAFVKFK